MPRAFQFSLLSMLWAVAVVAAWCLALPVLRRGEADALLWYEACMAITGACIGAARVEAPGRLAAVQGAAMGAFVGVLFGLCLWPVTSWAFSLIDNPYV